MSTTTLPSMSAVRTRSADEAALHDAIDARVAAVRAKDAEALLAAYALDVMTFDLVPPMRSDGTAAVKKRVTEWFDSFVTAIDYEVKDVELFVDEHVAFDHHLTHVSGTNKSGTKIDMWFRETIGYRKMRGEWKVVHQHSSVPFDMKTGKPVLTLDTVV